MSATSDWYGRAAVELAATSELQVAWARTVAGDPELLALIDRLPGEHRQPSLLFSAASWCGAPAVADPSWRQWIIAHWPAIEDAARTRRTQTNEVGRCIPLLIGLDRIVTTDRRPIALLELGAAAGLCLALDQYSYRFDDEPVLGTGSPLLTTTTTGRGTAPTGLPDIVWRRGVDLAPLDVGNGDDVRWLEALLPPDRPERRARLLAAITAVRDDPPGVVEGDALAALPALAAAARAEAPGATLVIAALGTLVYLAPGERDAVVDAASDLGARLVTFEGASVLPGVAERLPGLSAPHPTPFVLALDGEPLAHAGPHGDRLSWLTYGVAVIAAAREATRSPGRRHLGSTERRPDGPDRRAGRWSAMAGSTHAGAPQDPPATELSDLDLQLLDFERAWANRVGAKEAAILTEFALPAARYYQMLYVLIDSPAALRRDPLLVRRLQRLRDARTRSRAARTFRTDTQDLTD